MLDGRNPAPVDMVNIPILYRVLAPSQVVVWDFWTKNSIMTPEKWFHFTKGKKTIMGIEATARWLCHFTTGAAERKDERMCWIWMLYESMSQWEICCFLLEDDSNRTRLFLEEIPRTLGGGFKDFVWFLLKFLGEMIQFNNSTNLIEGADTTYELFGRTTSWKTWGANVAWKETRICMIYSMLSQSCGIFWMYVKWM